MHAIETKIPGCYELQSKAIRDDRGLFMKVFNSDVFESLGLCTEWKEQYYSVSRANVVRGLHFQLPPYDHVKLVYCIDGSVEDVVLDLRVGSPTYGQVVMIELSAKKGNMIYIPTGLAHGFCTPNESATMVYNVSSIYKKDADTGILWNSAEIPWSLERPALSERDKKFIPFANFKSPFHFGSSGETIVKCEQFY